MIERGIRWGKPGGGEGEPRLTDSRLANVGANVVYDAFIGYQRRFQTITGRALHRFRKREWPGMQADTRARLDIYKEIVDDVVVDIRALLGEREQEKLVWAGMKAVYSGLIARRNDWELAETFFNSVTRRIFATVGVDPQIEFVDTDYDLPPNQTEETVYRTYPRARDTRTLVAQILSDQPFHGAYEDAERDAALVARAVEDHLRQSGALRVVERVELIKPIFFRGKGAYLVGRLFSGSHRLPFILCLLHPDAGVAVDAVLMDEDAVSILFSFTRSYFHVDAPRPYDLVRFLKTIMPRKRTAELYISIGFNKHGKTELYRDILHHLSYSRDRFEIAQGQKGMVMTVFTMPGYDLVFKLIKDQFGYPKRTTRELVMDKYHLVFKHDRAGRLIDAQEFEHLQLRRARFSEELLAELEAVAGDTVSVCEEDVIIRHAYVERRIIPLDLYLYEADAAAAQAAIVEYGNAIKDLAMTNIFPGDMLLKNFGVTRHGRVVFYDYDELCLLTSCNFREIPPARHYEDELAPEPWYSVGEDDIFPEQFANFLGIHGAVREAFLCAHADLLEVDFWRNVQERLEAGEIINIFPYREPERLRQRYPGAYAN